MTTLRSSSIRSLQIAAILTILVGSAAFLVARPLPAKAAPITQTLLNKYTCTPHAARQKYSCAEVTIKQVTIQREQGIQPWNTVYGNCPSAPIFSSAFDSNDAKFAGTVTNTCAPTLTNGLLEFHVTNSCNASIGSGSDDASANIPSPWYHGVGYVYSFSVEGRCVVCLNGVPSIFPPFELTGTTMVQGRAGTTTYVNDNPAGTTSIIMANSPNYPLPCPG